MGPPSKGKPYFSQGVAVFASIAGRKSLGGFSVPRPVCINTGIACCSLLAARVLTLLYIASQSAYL